ncbi:MAG: hypothetical protein AAFP04_10100 [Myxococcota bacterium]
MNDSLASPSRPLNAVGWFAVFVAGFCVIFLLFFPFYAGVFALEIYAERNMAISLLTRFALEGQLPIGFGLTTAAILVAASVASKKATDWVRPTILLTAVLLGIAGIVSTIWFTYAPLIEF